MANRRIELDATRVRELEVDLSQAPRRVQFQAKGAVKAGAKVVNKQMKIDAAGHMGNWFGRPGTSYETPLARHVSWNMIAPLEAEIGIAFKGAGKLAHIIVYGSVNNEPVYDHTAALRRSEPRILELMGNAAEDSVFGWRGRKAS